MQESVRCAFFGGPWADEVKVMPDDRDTWLAPVLVDIALFVQEMTEPAPSASMSTRVAVYRLGGISDDGTRRYYPDGVR